MSPRSPGGLPPRRTRRARSAWLCLGGVACFAACGEDAKTPAPDSNAAAVAPIVAPADSAMSAAPDAWSVTEGSAVYLPADGGSAQVILPPVQDDSVPRPSAVTLPPDVAPASIDLFSAVGKLGTVSVGEFAPGGQPDVAETCDVWPVVPLRDVAASVGRWRVALRAGTAEGIRMDSIGGLAPADSARLVVEINKAAALLPLDSAGLLRRVPFGVTLAYRTTLAGDVELVVAVVERRLNVEAAPKTERTVLVLEKAPGARAFTAAWRDTQFAVEDDLIAIDLLGAVLLGQGLRPTVFLGLDFGDGSRVQMLQRSAAGTWSLRWSSAYTGC